MNCRRFVLIAAVLLAEAACAGLPISNVGYSLGYLPGEELYACNDVPVIVVGNPFAVPQAEFAAAAIDAMQGWSAGPDHFIPATNPNAVYRVVVMINPSNNVIGETLCARPPTAQPVFGAAPAPRIPLAAALCRGNSYLAYAYGSIAADDGPRGDGFRRGFGYFIRTLFPPRNPQRTPDRGCNVFC
jgi:hypothetical protein